MIIWKGVFPALTTKFDGNDKLDIPLFLRNLQAQLDAGVHGIILGGTLGEASTLTESEKERLVRSTVEYTEGRIPVVLNVAEGATREAIRQAGLANTWGAEGLMLLPPMRYRGDAREVITFFREVVGSTSLPVMIYNNPVDYGNEVTLDMFETLLELPNIQAVKESTRDISNITRIKNRFGDRLKILCGVDTLAMESLLMGADGWVAGLVCAFPKETTALYQYIQSGNIKDATFLYRWFLPLLELDIHPKLVQYIKLAEFLEGIGSPAVRAPRLSLEGSELERISAVITDARNSRPELKNLQIIT
jgi:dihydrodipicolinate synthase/N-acetylneuraminate lyase